MARKRKRTPIRKDILSPNLTLNEYRTAKMEMIEIDMCIVLTDEQKSHFNKLNNEIQIDNYARKIIFDKWD